NMTKNLEKEISPENYEKFKKTAARLNELELYEAYKNSLLLVMELRNLVEKQYQLTVSNDFFEKLLHYMNEEEKNLLFYRVLLVEKQIIDLIKKNPFGIK